jgi:hypothetical protein
MNACYLLNLNYEYVIAKIDNLIKNYKEKCLEFQINSESYLIIRCLNNYNDFNLIYPVNLVTYAGPFII